MNRYKASIGISQKHNWSDLEYVDVFTLSAENIKHAKEKVDRSKNFYDISLAYPNHRLHVVVAPHKKGQKA